uniref:Uncharacterized protein n=1 Tax=Spermophilus dauricus TaxID=99837 RepID=A0A8C9PK04_SPEDA
PQKEENRVSMSPNSNSSSSTLSSNQQTEKQTNTPQKEENRVSMSPNSKLLFTSAKGIQKELADITLDPPPNCSAESIPVILIVKELFAWIY